MDADIRSMLKTAARDMVLDNLIDQGISVQRFSDKEASVLYDEIMAAPAELDKVVTGLINYWNSAEPTINLTVVKDGKPFQLFNERELVHLRDVKSLIRLDYRVLLVTLLYVLGYAAAVGIHNA